MRSGGLRSAARAAARQGDWLSAARHYELLVRTRGARAGDRIQLGHALKELGHQDAALAAYGAAANRHPLHLDAQRQYGLYLRRLGRETEALDVLARALALAPDAADIADEIADMSPSDAAALDRHFLQGILGGSDATRDDRPSPIAWILAELALARARRSARVRDWPTAEHHYRTVLAHAPNWANARVQLGHALLEQGRPADALNSYRRALVSSPRNPDLFLHAGHALKLLKRRGSALDAYLAAWRLKPGFIAAFEEIRGLRPDIDSPALLADGEIDLDTGGGAASVSEPGIAGRRRLTPPRGLNDRQKSLFKHLAGAMAYKD